MKKTQVNPIVALFLAVFACLGIAHAALAAPGDFLFQIGTPQLFSNAKALAVDARGNIFVMNPRLVGIQKVDSAGKFITQWGLTDNTPTGIGVDAAGNVYVADLGNDRVQKYDNNGKFLLQWGSAGSGDGQFDRPSAVAADSAGHIYVADSLHSRIQKFDASGTYLGQWGSIGSGAGQFLGLKDLAVDCSGNVYATDSTYNSSRIQKFSSNGAFLLQWGGTGTGNGQFSSLDGIAADCSGNVYASDGTANRIQKFDNSGNYLAQWGGAGNGNGQFNVPVSLALDSAGNLYVADTLNERIQKFSPAGIFLAQFRNNADGQLNAVSGVAADSSGNAYVVDGTSVQKYAADGSALTRWENSGAARAVGTDPCGNVYVVNSSRVSKYTGTGQPLTQWGFSLPNGYPILPALTPDAVAADSSCNNVYVVDYHNSQVMNFTSSGTFVKLWDRAGLQWPYGIAVDQAGFAYVANTYGDSIVKYDSSGNVVTRWGSTGTGAGQFNHPYGVAVDSAGNVYVADSGNFRIQVFSDTGTFRGQWGARGIGPGQLSNNMGLAVNPAGTVVFVAEVARVQVFSGYGTGYLLQYLAGPNGSISGVAKQTVPPGGSGSQVTAVANSGYQFISWSDGVTTASRTDSNVSAHLSVTANFSRIQATYTLTFKAGAGGTVRGTSPQILWPGGWSSSVTAAPNTGYHFVNWTGDNGFITTTVNPLQLKNVQAAYNITANFALDAPPSSFTLTFRAGAGGSISGPTPQVVSPGVSSAPVSAVANTGYHFVNWSGDNGFVTTTANPLSVLNVQASQTITANFAPDQVIQYTITFRAGPGGTIGGPPSPQTVNAGGSTGAEGAIPSPGYHFVNWTGDNGFVTSTINPLTITNVQASQTITANFAPDQVTQYTITFNVGPGGAIGGPPSPQTVNAGGSTGAEEAMPFPGYHFVNWTGTNGFVTTTANPLVITNVQASQTVTANFAADTPPSTYTLTFRAASGGTVSGTSPQILYPGGWSSPVRAVPNSGYKFVNWTGDNGFTATVVNPLQLQNVMGSYNITANFAVDQAPSTYTLTFKAGTGGTISGTSPQILYPGGWRSAVTAVAKAGYHFVNWTGDNGFTTTASNPLVLKNVAASQNLTANFASNP